MKQNTREQALEMAHKMIDGMDRPAQAVESFYLLNEKLLLKLGEMTDSILVVVRSVTVDDFMPVYNVGVPILNKGEWTEIVLHNVPFGYLKRPVV